MLDAELLLQTSHGVWHVSENTALHTMSCADRQTVITTVAIFVTYTLMLYAYCYSYFGKKPTKKKQM